jgi:hypothetical protein
MSTRIAPLSGEEIVDALRVNSPALAEQLHSVSIRLNDSEDKRQQNLNAKAQGLLTAAGLSLTVAFTFGGLLLKDKSILFPIGSWLSQATAGAYGLALMCGLLASVFATKALLVTDDYRGVRERDILSRGELDECDAIEDEPKCRARFHRYATAHYWQIWQKTKLLHERKAITIKCGQYAFLGFLMLLLMISFALAYSAFIAQSH